MGAGQGDRIWHSSRQDRYSVYRTILIPIAIGIAIEIANDCAWQLDPDPESDSDCDETHLLQSFLEKALMRLPWAPGEGILRWIAAGY